MKRSYEQRCRDLDQALAAEDSDHLPVRERLKNLASTSGAAGRLAKSKRDMEDAGKFFIHRDRWFFFTPKNATFASALKESKHTESLRPQGGCFSFIPINISFYYRLCHLIDAEYKTAVQSLETFRKKREECFDQAYLVNARVWFWLVSQKTNWQSNCTARTISFQQEKQTELLPISFSIRQCKS